MICPKCEIGENISVILKMNGKVAHLCDNCETLWLEGEEIKAQTGHDFEGYKQGTGLEYVVEESEGQDQDHRAAQYPKYK